MALGDTILPINRALFPNGFCQGPQAIGDFIAQNMQVILPGTISFFVTGPTEPAVEMRSRTWVKTDTTTNTIIGIFNWSPLYGRWLRNHWEYNGGVPPFDERRIYAGVPSVNLGTYDGGEFSGVSDITGPFWQIASEFSDRWPIGVGTTIPIVGTTANVFTITTPATPPAIGVYFIKPTSRIFDRGN